MSASIDIQAGDIQTGRGSWRDLADIMKHERVKSAFAFIDRSSARFTEEHIRICEIPAPPFAEEARGEYIATRFRELGLSNVYRDEIGNVIGHLRPAQSNSAAAATEALLVLSAHLDTVFPSGTDVTVRRDGKRLLAPGIGDDVAGLAALIALIEILNEARIEPASPIAFVATVGEEGEGDLRGARHLFTKGALAGRIANFISFDGAGVEWITHKALGSRRYRIVLRGPGGHSWGDFGVVNPVHAIGRVVTRLASYSVPRSPRTTYNVGRIEGGESVNVIPESASIDVDLRSTSEEELSRIERFLLVSVRESIDEENAACAHSGTHLESDVSLIGSRPSGEISPDAPIVRAALEVARLLGIGGTLNRNSTDSNIPISLGIPAITIGAGGISGNSHRLTEWYDPTGREIGYRRALLLTLAITGLI